MEKQAQDEALKLKEEVAKQYEVKPGKVRKFFSAKFGMVDLNEVTLPLAKKLAEAGILVPKPAQKDKAPKE